MNTFAAMKPAPRPPEALGVRSGAEAVAASAEGVAEAFGAVLGALTEGRPAGESRREDKTGDETPSGTVPSPAEPAKPLLGLIDAGIVPQGLPAPLAPVVLQALLARAVPAAAPTPGEIPSALTRTGPVSGGASMPGQTVSGAAATGETAVGRATSGHVESEGIVSVPAGVADVAAGIALAIEGGRPARSSLVQHVPTEPGSFQAIPSQPGFAPQSLAQAPGEARSQAPGEARSQGLGEGRSRVTILQQETHFAPVRPRLVAGEAVAMPAIAAQASPTPAPVSPVLGTMTPSAAEAVPASQLPAVAALGVDASARTATPAGAPAAPADMPATMIQAGSPPAGSLPAPSPESAGRPRRAEAVSASAETVTVASPAAQRLAGQALPVEAAHAVPGDVSAPEAGPREGIAPIATAPGGALPSAATLGEPARQVAEAVASELSRPAATATTTAMPGGEGPLRLLTIQLRPMDLGTVLVRMRLRDGQLEMSLHASREETAALLRQDGALLTDLLRSSGYQPDTITIASNGAGAPSQGDGGRPGSGTPFQPGGQGGQAQGGANPDQAPRRQGDANTDERADLTHERIHETISSGPDRSGLYL